MQLLNSQSGTGKRLHLPTLVTKGIIMASCFVCPPTKRSLLGAIQAIGIAAALLSMGVARQSQATSLITNGSFESLTTQASLQFGTGYTTSKTGVPVPVQTVTGWTTSGYNFVFLPGTADTTGATGASGSLKLWGPGDKLAGESDNGLPAYSPDGGNYIAADGAYQVATINQTLTGLSPGSLAVVSFYWAGAQQSGYSGATTEQWTVGFTNDPNQATPVVQNTNHGFTGWTQQTFSFVVKSTTAVLSFLANGTPGGEPPFSLLDGVTLVQVPEPASWAVLLTGCGLAGLAVRRRTLSRR